MVAAETEWQVLDGLMKTEPVTLVVARRRRQPGGAVGIWDSRFFFT
jgi:hypothetical protein